MIELGLIAGFGVLSVVALSTTTASTKGTRERLKQRTERLWAIAQKSMRDRKFIPAEKALLTILKLDHKNAPAYNRLGILYARQHNFSDAVECFEIASSLEPKASSLHNLGLIYYEIEKYDKAIDAFRQALELEPMAARFIALAKVYQKQDKAKPMLDALEQAAELEPNPQTFKLLLEAYEATKNEEKINEIKARLQKMVVPKGRPNRVRRSRKAL